MLTPSYKLQSRVQVVSPAHMCKNHNPQWNVYAIYKAVNNHWALEIQSSDSVRIIP